MARLRDTISTAFATMASCGPSMERSRRSKFQKPPTPLPRASMILAQSQEAISRSMHHTRFMAFCEVLKAGSMEHALESCVGISFVCTEFVLLTPLNLAGYRGQFL